MHSQLPPIYYIIFTGITCFGVLLQAFVLSAMFFAIRRVANRIDAIADELRPHVLPAVITARGVIEDVAPKLKVISSDAVEVTKTVRREVDHVSATLDDVLKKTATQANRVDEMVSASIDSAAHATQAVQHAFSVPVRQASALFAGIKAGFDVLRGKNHSERPPEDEYCE